MVVGYPRNLLNKQVLMARPNPLLSEFGIHNRLEICVSVRARRVSN